MIGVAPPVAVRPADGDCAVYPFPAGALNGVGAIAALQYRGCVSVQDRVLFVADREAYDFASELIDSFGEAALSEAALRAERSRDVGNHIHYTRWCRVGRAILLLGDPEPIGTLH